MDIDLMKDENVINNIFDNIKELVISSRNKVYSAVNTEMLKLYWNIGKSIMEIQQSDERASYGDAALDKLSQKLTKEFGKGFSKRNLERMRKFYKYFPIATTVSSQLSWSHYLELIKIEEDNKRNFYLNECINTRYKRFFNRKYLSKYEKKLIQQQLFMENINIKVDLINRKIKLPKLKWIKMREYRNIKKIDGKFVL